MISTYFGNMTIVLKLPLTRAASTKGLQRYNGFWTPGAGADGDAGGAESVEVTLGNVEEVGVGERLGPLGPERCIERLGSRKETRNTCQLNWHGHQSIRCIAHPMELKNDITCALTDREAGCSIDGVGL